MWILKLIIRSLTSKQRRNTSMFVAVIGITIGVTSLIAVIGIMNGLQNVLINNLIAINSYEYKSTIEKPLSFEEIKKNTNKLANIKNIRTAVAFVDEFGLLQIGNKSHILQVRAIDSTAALQDKDFIDALTQFPNETKPTKKSFVPEDSIILGWNFGLRYGLQEGDVISLTLPGEGAGFTPIKIDLVVADFFYSQSQYDRIWSFISLETYINRTPNKQISNVHIGTRLQKNSQSTAETIKSIFPQTQSWKENNQSFYVALKTEKVTLAFLSIIIFTIIVLHFRFAILRRINSKRDDIVSLRTMGASPLDIKMWFLGEGFVISTLGIFLGLGIGISFVMWYQPILTWIEFNITGNMGSINNLGKGMISKKELIFVSLFAFCLLFFTVWTSIKRLTHIAPMQVIRYE